MGDGQLTGNVGEKRIAAFTINNLVSLALTDRVMGGLPEQALAVLDRVAVIVEDEPAPELLVGLELELEPGETAADVLCGLHTGVADTEASVEYADAPSVIHLFRRGILSLVGGWAAGDQAVAEEIRVTVLHEIGHQYGLDEDDLADLGYD